jgi:hypothetical protein
LIKHFAKLLLCFISLFGAGLAAGETPIDTDGPDFVESSEVVGKRRFQVETDIETIGGVAGSRKETLVTNLLRFGISDAIELRMQRSMEASAFGVKWHSQDRDPLTGAASVSWIFHLTAPSYAKIRDSSRVQPSIRSVITWELPKDWSLGLMPGIGTSGSPSGKRYSFASLGVVFGNRLNDRCRVFIESATPQIAHARDGGVISSANIGTAFLLSNDLQIGARISKGLNQNTLKNSLLLEMAARF